MAIHRPQNTSQITLSTTLSMVPPVSVRQVIHSTTGPAGQAHSCRVMTARGRHAMVLATQLNTGVLMESGDYDQPLAPGLLVAQSWQATVTLGAVTLILGFIVSFHPGGSLNVLAVLVGVLMVCSGIFYLVRAFGPGAGHRGWLRVGGGARVPL